MSPSPCLPPLNVACNACNLTRICLPNGMLADHVRSLNDVVRRNRTLRKGDAIYLAGERFSGIFALRSGSAKLVYSDSEGQEMIVAVLLPGELLGFDGVSTGRYRCSLVTLETSSYCELPAHDLRRLGQEQPAIQEILLQRTAEQFDQSIERMAAIQQPADARLAGFLLDLAERFRRRGFSAERFHLSLTRQEIGNHLGLALETVSRLLGKFEARHLIRVRGRSIEILEASGLRRIGRTD